MSKGCDYEGWITGVGVVPPVDTIEGVTHKVAHSTSLISSSELLVPSGPMGRGREVITPMVVKVAYTSPSRGKQILTDMPTPSPSGAPWAAVPEVATVDAAYGAAVAILGFTASFELHELGTIVGTADTAAGVRSKVRNAETSG